MLAARAAALASALSLCASPGPFKQVSSDALSFYNDFTNNFGPEDKMLECNGAMVFIDLDNVWEQVCSQCIGGQTAGECTSLQVTVVSSLSDCQAACQQAPTCTAINYAAPTQGCELLSCTVNPPTQASDPSNDLWSYNRGTALQYNNITNVWTGYAINAAACPDPNQPPAPLVPRDSGYTVGIIFDKGQGGGDRLVVLGGDQGENNVYFSDDCGRSWNCYDGDNVWDPRGFAPIVHPPLGMFPGNPAFMLGGDVQEALPSIGVFVNTGDGTSGWARPTCDGASPCPYACNAPDSALGYCTPDSPVYPGQVVTDGTAMWLFMDAPSAFPGAVFWLNSTNYATTGWTQLGGASSVGSLGRRAYVKGANPGAGCFFSTDFTANRLWNTASGPRDATSSNAFSTSRTAAGPWVPGVAPWPARGSAVVVASEAQDKIWVGGGFTFNNGAASAPAFGDVWTVDATVCLLGSNGAQCTDPSRWASPPDIPNLLCNCLPQWQGDDRCGSCTTGAYGPTCANTCPTGASGFCNQGNGWGVCDNVVGCKCNGQHSGDVCDQCVSGYWGSSCAACAPCSANGVCDGSGTTSGTGNCVCNAGATGTACDQCASGFFGASCSACAACSTHGTCDGSGTTSGTGACVCDSGWIGSDCSEPDALALSSTPQPAATPAATPRPASPTAAAAGLSPGAAAAVAVVVMAVAAGGALAVWAKFLGGGPALASAWSSVSSLGGGGGSSVERSSLLASSARAANVPAKQAAMTPSQLASRFGSAPPHDLPAKAPGMTPSQLASRFGTSPSRY